MKIVYTKKNRFYIGSIILENGVNEVSDKDWKEIKGHPQVKEFMKSDIISIKNVSKIVEPDPDINSGVDADTGADADADDGASESKEYSEMNVKEASAYIATITEMSELELIAETEERKGVKKAIKKQAKILDELNAE